MNKLRELKPDHYKSSQIMSKLDLRKRNLIKKLSHFLSESNLKAFFPIKILFI